MSAKPTTLARFAGTDPVTPSVEVVEPTSGLKDSGFTPGSQPPAGYLDWCLFWAYAWASYLNDGDLRGKHTIRQTDESTYTPLVAGLDPGTGNRRATIDHNGFRMGQVTDYRQDWNTSGTTEPPGWTFAGTNGTRAYNDPSSNMPYRHVQLDVPATNNSSASLTSQYIVYMDLTRTFVVEWDARTHSAIDSGVAMQYTALVIRDNGGAADRYIGFRCNTDGNTDIEVVLVDSGGPSTVVDTNVAWAINTTYRFRIELVGDTNHAGSNCLIRCFINGNLVYSATTADFNTDKFKLQHSLTNGNPGSAYRLFLGPIRASFNHRSAPDNL